MMISVIIPHLNQPHALTQCLFSLMRQTLPRNSFEIIVVDNGSSVDPVGIVTAFPDVRLTYESLAGPGPARNRGVSVSHGEVLAFIDADCFADPRWLEEIWVRFLANEDRIVLGGDVRIAYGDPRRVTAIEAYETVFAFRQKLYIKKHGFSGTGNLAVRRDTFHAIGPFAGIGIPEDREWGRRASARGFRIAYMPDMIVYHPARKSMKEIFITWDRHIAHSYNEWLERKGPIAAWRARAVALLLSAPAESFKVLTCKSLRGARVRMLAIMVLFRIRLYRTRGMFRICMQDEDASREIFWNR